jgi:hypothetical protein
MSLAELDTLIMALIPGRYRDSTGVASVILQTILCDWGQRRG